MSWGIVASVGGAVLGAAVSSNNANKSTAASNNAAYGTNLQAEIASDQWDKYQEIYEPLEKKVVADADKYDSPENYAKAAGDASATVSQQYSKARDRLTRTPGLDSSTPGYAASMAGLDLSQAATDATSQNTARQGVTDKAYARKLDALSLGKGLPATASATLGQVANSSLAQAKYSNDLATSQASSVGSLANRLVNTPTVQGWLGNTSATQNTSNSGNENGGSYSELDWVDV